MSNELEQTWRDENPDDFPGFKMITVGKNQLRQELRDSIKKLKGE